MEKGMKSKAIGIFIGLFLIVAAIVGILGVNDLIWIGSKIDLDYPRNDFHYEFGEKPTQDLPVIKVTEENFRKIQAQAKVSYVEYQVDNLFFLGIKFPFLNIKFWTIADDCVFYVEKTQNLPLFRQIKNAELDLESDEMTLVINNF